MKVSTEPVILKLGGSVITDKAADQGIVREADLLRIAKEVSEYRGKMIIVHGAGSFGHTYAKKYGLDMGFDPEGVIITHESVKKLASRVVDALNEYGVRAIAVHPMGCTVCRNGRIESMYLDNIKLMLEKGFVPVLHGDMVMDLELGACVLSGDQIVAYLAKELRITRLGLGSAEDGVLDNNGKPILEITPETFETFKHHIRGSGSTDVTGGMLGKVQELLELSKTSCITSYIFNAGKGNNTYRFLNGESIGTKISPDKRVEV
ncbi:MAG: isopentenyl phosphate kinase [Methanosarcina thermophila]|jgi:isopentenyl phosphate kinase|uniref:Isopentenyl phosphate kinase n=3 Tax=Methanosarcina thermophila TaxID=2210 RepID=A0A1I6YRP3_METTE|nr:isopentenyl phosphate kinase [Methanosarcina thermophila]ALK05122.1 MAG: amino acid kinase [Methanosarcina sp. 795]AKB13876.1 Isopentenyl phosphate kinase [Methanosarcina thermophila TM-1]AKB15484.1 Isopentenyl phosphate kinase [Methanosarcina thermophila CHTI-55]NLU56353.1 isopentenyl phosphate kinase family protein [Methanosarcina thermophila]SFT53129.1 isopentenyl phosphate kinase [Methanosarcina thermophila]